jgi:hypothetical protein
MAETARLALTLLESGQAQKHVTVNEALARVDAFCGAHVLSRSVATPPASPAEGDLYIAPAGAADAWAGLDGRLVAWLNGGWADLAPEPGRRLRVLDEGRDVTFDGAAWIAGSGDGGAATEQRVLVFDHDVAPGASSETAPVIPDKAILLGVTGRVLSGLGAGVAFRVGIPGAPDRYGSGYGGATGSTVHGVTGQPVAYYGATPLRLEAEGAPFAGGRIRLALHFLALTAPRGD